MRVPELLWYFVSMNTSSNPAGRLLIGQQSPALRQELWHLVHAAKSGDPLAPVTVIGPTRFANLALRHELGQDGFINVRFEVLSRVSELLGGAALARQGRRPLTPVMENVSLRQVLTGSSGPLASVSGHPSTQASLRASFAELRQEDESLLNALEAQGGVRAQVVGLNRSFRRRTVDDWYDADDLAEAAAQVLRQGETPALDDLGMMVIYLPEGVSPAGAGLIEELARRGRCSVLIATTGEDDADRPARELAGKLRPLFGTDVEQVGVGDNPPSSSTGTTLHIAPSAHEELRWVIRQVVLEASEGGVPIHRMAVLYRLDSPYATLIPDELAMAGIPMSGPGRTPRAESGIGRVLLGLLRLAGSEFRRSDVMSWLTGSPVSPPYGRTPGFNPSRWDILTRRAGIIGGVEQWRLRLDRYAGGLEEDADERERMGEIDEVRAASLKAEAASARHAADFIAQLAADLEPPAPPGSWTGYCKWAKDLLGVYLSRELPADGPAAKREQDARREVDRLLDELPSADTVSDPPTLDAFRQTIEEALGAAGGTLGPTGGGVFVSSFAAAAGMSFDVIWMVGMIEGGVPPPIRPDPLLPESSWIAAGGRPRGSERIASERREFLSAMASAPRRALSYPVADGGSQRQAYPSRWFLEQVSSLEGRRIYAGDLPSLRGRPWLTVDDSGVQALNRSSGTSLADIHDYNLHRLLRWRRDGGRTRQHPLARQGPLSGAIELGRSRSLRRWTEFDGNLTGVASSAKFAVDLGEAPVSPTRLENWAACPLRYFLGQVLRLSALETPEETVSISAADRGRLVHGILERFISDAVSSDSLPMAGGLWSAEDRDRLWQVAEQAFANAEQNGQTGKPLLWQLDKQGIREDLESFLEEDAKLRSVLGTGRVLVETRFGFNRDGLDVTDDETHLRFRGYIDRVDVSADGGSVTVIDYKTGSARPYEDLDDDPIDRGKRLQLGVYSLAARRLAPEASSVRAAYWFTTNNGGFAFAPSDYFDIDDDATLERFRDGVSAVVSGIREGVFPANPGPMANFGAESDHKNCHYCDFDSLCPARRAVMWGNKKSDQRLAGYIRLSEGGESGNEEQA